MLYGTRPIVIPKAMASVRADGGIVSTARDGIVFLEAFMGGRLFPAEYLSEMQRRWNPIFRPLEYGAGIMRFALPRYYTLGRRVPPMVGHSGASGAVLYYVSDLDLSRLGHGQSGQEAEPLVQPADAAGHGLSGCLGSLR